MDEVDIAIQNLIHSSQRIALISHIRPDGDAIGSLLGLGIALKNNGKEVQLILADGLPSAFRHLSEGNQIAQGVKEPVDLVIVVDCSDQQRTGSVLKDRSPDINIDHHITNTHFATVNLVKPDAVATCEILTEKIESWGLQLTPAVANALLSGIITDTIGYRTSNMTPKALRLSASLMEKGANLPDLYSRALALHSFEAVKLWGEGLSRIQREGDLVWTTLTLEDRAKAGYPGNDDADLVNILSTIENGKIAVIFLEQKGDHVKVSWRAQPGLDVSNLAVKFGGGGHPAAAGADIPGNLEEIQKNVLLETHKILNNGINYKHKETRAINGEIEND